MHHALEKDPRQRYQSAADMASDLRRHLAGRPITLHEPGLATRLRRWLRLRPRVRRLVLGLAIATIAVVATLVLVPGMVSGPPVTWAGLYSRLEEADQLRHSGPQNRENYLAAAALFQQARSDLSRLPVEPFTADLNRYIKWRQGELHYFVGEMEHDAAMLEQARGFWRMPRSCPGSPAPPWGSTAWRSSGTRSCAWAHIIRTRGSASPLRAWRGCRRRRRTGGKHPWPRVRPSVSLVTEYSTIRLTDIPGKIRSYGPRIWPMPC
ncbi:MAG: hypothetical protein IPM94_14510 [bacterium]|nr:hypothetical protein [bacterium]